MPVEIYFFKVSAYLLFGYEVFVITDIWNLSILIGKMCANISLACQYDYFKMTNFGRLCNFITVKCILIYYLDTLHFSEHL